MVIAGPDVIQGDGQTNSSPLEQSEPLLRTKLFAPPARPGRIARQRLFAQLNMGLDKTLVLVSAPPGYGKTTLVSSWLGESGLPSTWISLDEDDNDPMRFLHYLLSALHRVVPTIQLDLLAVLQDTQPTSLKFLSKILVNEIAGCAIPFVLILDDFHVIEAQPVLDMIVHLLEYSPPHMHVILISRTDPPLPLSRWRVRDQLVDLRLDQLRFTQDEIARLLNGEMGLELAHNDILALEARTEGWIAGLQMAAISMQGGEDVHGFVSAFTGSHHYIMDYLVEEVLKLQPGPVRSFLLQSSVLERMCAPLCAALVEDHASSAPGAAPSPFMDLDTQSILEHLQQANLFIVPLDNERAWFRYHHLFADVLNRRLERDYPQQIPDLHRRASRWYEDNGYIFDAIRHTLLAGDRERAARLVDQHGCQLLMRGEVINLLHWIDAVEPYSGKYPWIAVQKGWALCLTGQLDRAEAPLKTARQLIAPLPLTDDVRTLSGAATAAQAHRANLQGEPRLAADLARQALDQLPVSSDLSCSLRSVVTSILGDSSWITGDLAGARRAYADAVLISQASANVHMTIIANLNLAQVLMEQGQLHQAAITYSETLQIAAFPDGRISPLADSIYAGLSKVAYEWNRLEDAASSARLCIELARRWGRYESQAQGELVSAGLALAAGNSEVARVALCEAEQLLGEHPVSPWQSASITSALVRFWIIYGDLDRASYLVELRGLPVDGVTIEGEISYLQEPLFISLLRLRLARGDYDAALALSERLLKAPQAASRVERFIEILALQALAFQGVRNTDQAVTVLGKALSLARPEGYVRTFLDEGEGMARLLYQVRSHRNGIGYAAELLSALGRASGSPLPPVSTLIEPLTPRELEVLKLIEAGFTNQDIAGKLVISMPTVKRHISNIYTKLGASSRTQAIARARELNLFR